MIRLFIVFLCLPGIHYGQSWPLQKCIKAALENNLNVQSAELDIDIANNELIQAKANLQPNIDATFNSGFNWGHTLDPFTNQFGDRRINFHDATIIGGFELFSGFRRKHLINQVSSGIDVSEHQAKLVRRELKIDITSKYMQVLLDQQLLKVMDENIDGTQTKLLAIRELLQKNQATKRDELEILSFLAEEQYQLRKAENKLNQNLERLKFAIGLEKGVPFEVDTIMSVPNRTRELANIHLNSLPEVQLRTHEVQRQNSEIKVIQSENSPSLSLNGFVGTGVSENNLIFINGETRVQPLKRQIKQNAYERLFLTLRVPITSSRPNRLLAKSSKLRMKKLELERQETLVETDLKINQLISDVSDQEALITTLEAASAFANENHKYNLLLYDNQQITYTELMASKQRKTDATFKLSEAKARQLLNHLIVQFYLE